jgi:chorismate--pyruvate lyase
MSNEPGIRRVQDDGASDQGDDGAALFGACDLHPGLARWLTSDGLLTERLRALPDMRLRPLAETDVALTDGQRRLLQTPDGTGRLREISLEVGATRCVYGCSLIPVSLLQVYPWLGALGEKPLGATLTARLEVTRGPFSYCRLAADELLARRATGGASSAPLWSRRSTFQLPGGRILVTEVFLPALAPWPVS